ncbi:melanoma cell adhesion molecule b isoform X2 [Hippocampus zosterae]|uniref:melanoma cell adhesion molecule b isoform X1 n=1 Tax=Hippocampus zosterae TaxID=109293 RepID=UPI00223D9F7A|nr:melanoma cell adhesion molecule b isoform X1 [Hippocampus zosterae]XP_051933909.1 melanoma cell adhesion molecule b isoform X2 [Hippocampus zosterae]
MDARHSACLLAGLVFLLHGFAAWAAVEVSMEDRVEVLKGETAQITCMFTSDDGIGALTIRWFYVSKTGEKHNIYYQDATTQMVERSTSFTDRIMVNVTMATGEVVLTITDVQLKDQLEFICLIKSLTDGVSEGRTKLLVFERPDSPTIEGVQTGIYVSEATPSKIGSCEVKNGFPKPNITWYRNNAPIQGDSDEVKIMPSTTMESSGLFSVRSELSLKVMKEDKDAQFYCKVTYLVPGGTRMTETNRINITVYYPSTAVNVWVESPKGKIKEGDSIMFHCYGNGNTPSSVYTIKHGEKEYTLESNTLILENVTRLQNGYYECISIDMETFDELSGNTTVFVNYLEPAVVLPTNIEIAQGEELTATCNALSSLQTHTAWFKNGREVSVGHTLIVKDVTFDTAGAYTCVVTVPEIKGMEEMKTLRVTVKGAPQIMKPEHTDLEESVANTVELTCHVRGFPSPQIIWTTNDGKILETTSQNEMEDGVHSMVSVEVTSDLTAFCNASNEYGADALAFNIKAIVYTTAAATTTSTSTNRTSTLSSTTVVRITAAATTTSTSTLSSSTVQAATAIPPKKIRKESNGVIIAVIIICILLLAILGSVLYFLYKKGKICGRSGKQDLTKEKSSKDNIVVEMKSDNTEDAVLLGVNGEKLLRSPQ